MGKDNPYKQAAKAAAKAPLNVTTFLKNNKAKQQALQKAMEAGFGK